MQKADLDGVSNYMKNFLNTFTSTDPYKNSVEQNWLATRSSKELSMKYTCIRKVCPQASGQNINTYSVHNTCY